MALKGSCHCRAVQYEIDGLDGPIRHCHCITCRKTQATSFNTSAIVARDRFRWISGQDKLSSYESSPGKFRHFCSVCGAHIVAEYPSRPVVILRLATLDDDPGIKPSEHIWTSHDVPWLTDGDNVKRYGEWYPGH
ncbi:MAG TPA: GFA family protein [Hyphomicrobiales bacterium]|nr:GFA family protein [Hyphomicrobiales bacterium]